MYRKLRRVLLPVTIGLMLSVGTGCALKPQTVPNEFCLLAPEPKFTMNDLDVGSEQLIHFLDQYTQRLEDLCNE